LVSNTGLSNTAAIGSLVAAVIGGILLALAISIIAFVAWRRRGGSKPYYYKSAAVHEVLFDGTCPTLTWLLWIVTALAELKPNQRVSARESTTPGVTPYIPYDTPQAVPRSPPTRARTVMSQSSIYSLGSDYTSPPSSSRQAYFPLPSEYQSKNLLEQSKVHHALEIVVSIFTAFAVTLTTPFDFKFVIAFALRVFNTFFRPSSIPRRETAL